MLQTQALGNRYLYTYDMLNVIEHFCVTYFLKVVL